MTTQGIAYILIYFAVILALTRPLGTYMAAVFESQGRIGATLARIESPVFAMLGIRPNDGMDWKRYGFNILVFSAVSFVVLFLLLRLQGGLPLNPEGLPGTSSDLAYNTSASFTSNTNWQSYGGETTLSYLTQMLGLTVQNFVSAAVGIVVVVVLIRGFARRGTADLGNFWVDLTRCVLWVLLPLSIVLTLVLVWQGVIQNFDSYKELTTLEGAHQLLAMGPAASQIAIKQLGTNGGGFFNVNSAHPFENPTALSNFVELVAILLIPAALTYTFGRMVGNTRQGWAVFAAMSVIFLAGTFVTYAAEAHGNPALSDLGVNQAAATGDLASPGGNMEGKEVRFGIASSALWATATTAASNGSVNSMHDSYTPIGGLVAMFNIQLGEQVFGGVGSGLYGMLVFAIIAVFIAGLMVGRTPEYLGKKIGPREMKVAAIYVLITAFLILGFTAIAVSTHAGKTGPLNSGPHAFSEVLYAFTSAGGNNGSAFGGLGANTQFYNAMLGTAMLLGRFLPMIAVLALAGSLAGKQPVPASAGTLPTDGPLFTGLLIGVVIIVGGLTFFPALALGPIVEHFLLGQGATF